MNSPKNRASFVAILYLLAFPLHAQTMRLAGGYDGQIENGVYGFFSEVWLPNGWDVLAGIRNDGGVGFSGRKTFPFGQLTLGDSIIQFNPLGAGVITPIRGATLAMKNGFTFFVGATGESFTEPFLQTQNKFSSFGGGATYLHRFAHGFTVQGATLDAQHKLTALGSVAETSRHFIGYLSAGELLGNKSLNYGATLKDSIFFASASRQTLIADGLRTDFTSESGGVTVSAFTGGASHYASQTVSGDTVWALARIGDNTTLRGDYLTAQGEKVLDLGIIQKFGVRFTVSPGATRINGAWSWTMGGTFASNLATISASYEEQFLPFAIKNPWEKTLLVSVSLQLPHNARATVRSVLLPTGRLTWAAYGDCYGTGPLGSTNEAGGNVLLPSFQKNVLRGLVVDQTGSPVFGAAVRVGKVQLFTDTSGAFEMRSKQSTQPLSVNVLEFSVGSWRVIDCPPTVSAGEVVRITVERK